MQNNSTSFLVHGNNIENSSKILHYFSGYKKLRDIRIYHERKALIEKTMNERHSGISAKAQEIRQSVELFTNVLSSQKNILFVKPEQRRTTQSSLRQSNDQSFKKNRIKKILQFSQQVVQKKKCQCGKCQQCHKHFVASLKNLPVDLQGVPDVTAKSWAVWRKIDEKFVFIHSKRPYKQRQIASLTKLLVALVVSDKLKKWKLSPHKLYYEVTDSINHMKGTSAKLRVGEVINVHDLLHALLLPSGNDAALVLSQLIGLMMHMKAHKKQKFFDPYNYESFKEYADKSHVNYLISAMNRKCKELGMMSTYFYNPHGNDAFDIEKNKSCAYQLGKLCVGVMQDEYVRLICNTKQYKDWTNTNKLLWEGFDGLKTGSTQTAGSCMAATYHDIIVVTLHSCSIDQRWIQIKKLIRWAETKK